MIPSKTTLVAYYRVSTKRQQISGLGLDAQKQMASRSGNCIIAEYIEAESGKNSNRPEIAKAIAHAKRCKATLYIACLDRLARNVAFIANLMESGVEFIVGDMPYATKFTLHIMAAVAEEEGRRISERTKKGLEQAKLRGIKLGSNNEKWKAKRVGNPGILKASGVAAKNRTKQAREFYETIMTEIKEKRDVGCQLKEIADDLNAAGYLTRASMPYTASIICRLTKQYT